MSARLWIGKVALSPAARLSPVPVPAVAVAKTPVAPMATKPVLDRYAWIVTHFAEVDPAKTTAVPTDVDSL
jgi:hypothetical protein